MEPQPINSRSGSHRVSFESITILQRAKKTFWIDFHQDSVDRIIPQPNDRTQFRWDLLDQTSSIGCNSALELIYARSTKDNLERQAFSRSLIMEVEELDFKTKLGWHGRKIPYACFECCFGRRNGHVREERCRLRNIRTPITNSRKNSTQRCCLAQVQVDLHPDLCPKSFLLCSLTLQQRIRSLQ